MLWHLCIKTAPGFEDLEGRRVERDAAEVNLPGPWKVRASRGFLIEGEADGETLRGLAERLFADPVIETFNVVRCGLDTTVPTKKDRDTVVHVLPKPGVTDSVGESARSLLQNLGHDVSHCRSIRSYQLNGPTQAVHALIKRVLVKDAIETHIRGPIPFDRLGLGKPYCFELLTVPMRTMDDDELMGVSREGGLSLSHDEMRAIQRHFVELDRDPTDCELETLAQTWSEHCSHKTLKGRIEYQGQLIDNLLKQTIFKATQALGLDWLVSVFEDNAGVVRFDDEHDVCFKVETHNHPSAIEPYGGANTGLGGVIRDVLGTGLGAKPIANTDVFCVAAPETDASALPAGVLHPGRVLRGVVAGVRDYGNRMGIPTVNGALVVDGRYASNPLVFCGTIGVLPRGMAAKRALPGDLIVAIGGRTGRDGIHGATFSSSELTRASESTSGGAVQIGNAITEKMILDVIVQARDKTLFHAITDCGAGGFSSAVGEMGASLGAEVELEKAPLKYEGLTYSEIWISEAQERMVLAVPPEMWPDLLTLCEQESVEATVLGSFVDTGRLVLRYDGQVVCDLSMDFLHEGRPRPTRHAILQPVESSEPVLPPVGSNLTEALLGILHHWDVASKEWIIRQYDHEVQGRTVLKPLVGARDDGPGDAAVILPVRGSTRGLAIACGINPRFGEMDPYLMAHCVVDEAIRNCVAVGADPDRIALLDNFCWGNPERPETLGSLVEAARGCHDAALAFRTPFISGKDSLYNEYVHEEKSYAIPPTLLISAIGQVPDVSRCVSMELKEPGNLLLLAGITNDELGGSLWSVVNQQPRAGKVPAVSFALARTVIRAVFESIENGLIRACHDLSDGGLAVALAEMAMAGNLGARVWLRDGIRLSGHENHEVYALFSESTSRFLLEVRPEHVRAVEQIFASQAQRERVDSPLTRMGEVSDRHPHPRLTIHGSDGDAVVDVLLSDIENAWKRRPAD